MAKIRDFDAPEQPKKLDRLCLRMPVADAEWLILEAAKRQTEERRIVPVAELIADMFAARYGLKTDRRPQQPSQADKITYLPVLTEELRTAMEAERLKHKTETGQDLTYYDILQAEIMKRSPL